MALFGTKAALAGRKRLHKSFFPLRPGQQARFLPAKPPVPVPGHPIVHSVAQTPRQPIKDRQPGPGPAQAPGDFERGIGAGVQLRAIRQYDGVE